MAQFPDVDLFICRISSQAPRQDASLGVPGARLLEFVFRPTTSDPKLPVAVPLLRVIRSELGGETVPTPAPTLPDLPLLLH